eukprot:439790_1
MIDDHQQYYLFSMDKIPHYQVRRMPSSSWISIRLGIIQQVVFKVLRLVNLTLDDLQFQIGSNDFHDGTLGHTVPLPSIFSSTNRLINPDSMVASSHSGMAILAGARPMTSATFINRPMTIPTPSASSTFP